MVADELPEERRDVLVADRDLDLAYVERLDDHVVVGVLLDPVAQCDIANGCFGVRELWHASNTGEGRSVGDALQLIRPVVVDTGVDRERGKHQQQRQHDRRNDDNVPTLVATRALARRSTLFRWRCDRSHARSFGFAGMFVHDSLDLRASICMTARCLIRWSWKKPDVLWLFIWMYTPRKSCGPVM